MPLYQEICSPNHATDEFHLNFQQKVSVLRQNRLPGVEKEMDLTEKFIVRLSAGRAKGTIPKAKRQSRRKTRKWTSQTTTVPFDARKTAMETVSRFSPAKPENSRRADQFSNAELAVCLRAPRSSLNATSK